MTEDLRQALEDGELTDDQLRELIAHDAAHIGLSFDEAVDLARRGDLPNDPVGYTLRELVRMLDLPLSA